MPTLDRSKFAPAAGVTRGAYVLADTPEGKPEVILIATGSEVYLSIEAHEELLAEGIRSRVVSMPSWEIFDHQTREYRESVLPPDVMARVAIEQASTFGWERYVGPYFTPDGRVDLNIARPAIDAVAAELGVASVAADEIYQSAQ